MLYPGFDDVGRKQARSFAARNLSRPIRDLYESGDSLTNDELFLIATDAGEELGDVDARMRRGLLIGGCHKMLYALAHTDESRASWGNAMQLVMRSGPRGEPISRSLLQDARTEFGAVAHLWAALVIRDVPFQSNPSVGYEAGHDLHSFLAETELFLRWGRKWRPQRANAEPVFSGEAWRVPEGWRPLERQPGWPPTGKLPILTLDEEVVAEFARPGRPRDSTK
jgi:hypothetical protein